MYYVDLPWSWLRNSMRIRAQAGQPQPQPHTVEVVVTTIPAGFAFDGLGIPPDPAGCDA